MVNQKDEIIVSSVCVNKILKIAEKSFPDIAFGIALQAYVSLRVSELCSMNSETAPCGGSISFDDRGGTVKVSDDRSRTRLYQIHGTNVEQMKAAYNKHKKYVDEISIDSRHPLFVNAHGTALSTDGYIRRVQALNALLMDCNDVGVKNFMETLKMAGKRFTGDTLRRCCISFGE